MAHNPNELDAAIRRIETAPETPFDNILEAVVGSDRVKQMTFRRGILHGDSAPVAEVIDLADAGPFVDETKLPVFVDEDGTITGDNEHTAAWWGEHLRRISGIAIQDPTDPDNFHK